MLPREAELVSNGLDPALYKTYFYLYRCVVDAYDSLGLPPTPPSTSGSDSDTSLRGSPPSSPIHKLTYASQQYSLGQSVITSTVSFQPVSIHLLLRPSLVHFCSPYWSFHVNSANHSQVSVSNIAQKKLGPS